LYYKYLLFLLDLIFFLFYDTPYRHLFVLVFKSKHANMLIFYADSVAGHYRREYPIWREPFKDYKSFLSKK